MIIRAIALTGAEKQIIPPDGQDHHGTVQWTLINGAAVTTLSDDAAGTHTAPLPSGQVLQITGTNEQLFATGSVSITVIGSEL